MRETKECYEQVTRPYIDSLSSTSVQWIYDILEHKEEQDRIIYENERFILLPDFKWDAKDAKSLYCIALVKQRCLRSVRDLGFEHVHLLRDILTTSTEIIERRWNVSRTELLVYVHYLPSFFHFHVHLACTHKMLYPETLSIGRALFLEDVIDNLLNDHKYW